MQLKLRHLILFIIACALLIYADTQGGALLAIAVLMQLALLIHNIEVTRKAQLAVFKLFVVSLPLFLFLGGVHSFMTIYLAEGQYLFFFMAFSVTFFLCFLLNLQVVFAYWFLKKSNFELIATLQNAFNSIKERKMDFTKTMLLLFIFSFLPEINTDWKLVFAIMATHLYLNPAQVKKALLTF